MAPCEKTTSAACAQSYWVGSASLRVFDRVPTPTGDSGAAATTRSTAGSLNLARQAHLWSPLSPRTGGGDRELDPDRVERHRGMTFGQRGCSRPVTGAALGVWRGAWIARPLPFMSIRRAGLRPAISGSGLELDILRDLAATRTRFAPLMGRTDEPRVESASPHRPDFLRTSIAAGWRSGSGTSLAPTLNAWPRPRLTHGSCPRIILSGKSVRRIEGAEPCVYPPCSRSSLSI